ncbi:MAG: tetratricopeptide repeat protein [Candidatus Neomarinimicrobiota bacterium]
MSIVRAMIYLLRNLAFAMVLSGYLAGQSAGPVGNDIFFLDLGIVIESATGDEEVTRLVKAPPEKVKFFVDKAPSGSVFIASTREMQQTLNRISQKIETLEAAFEREVGSLRQENEDLRGMIADLLAREPISHPEEARVSTSEVMPLNVAPADATATKAADDEEVTVPVAAEEPREEELTQVSPMEINLVEAPSRRLTNEKRPFNRTVYMNAVFAYQREDFSMALRHFAELYLGDVDDVTAGNVLYWIADCYYQMGEYGETLRTLVAIEPLFRSDKQDDAMILTGLVYRQMGDEIQAIEAFANIIDNYPDSEYLKLAQLELRNAER